MQLQPSKMLYLTKKVLKSNIKANQVISIQKQHQLIVQNYQKENY